MDGESFVKSVINYKEYICEQTNCDTIIFGDLSDYDENDVFEIEIDDFKIKIGIKNF